MSPVLKANVRAHFLFYRRHRLLMVVSLFLLAIWGMSALPSLMMVSHIERFMLLRMLLEQTTVFACVFAGILALFTVSHPLQQRSLKMVVTKPCPIESWLLADFIAALALLAGLHLAIAAAGVGLFAAWGIAIQWGFLVVVIEAFLRTAIVFSVVTLLVCVVHPAVAVLLVMVANEWAIEGLLAVAASAAAEAGAGPGRVFYRGLEWVLRMVHAAVPDFGMLSGRLDRLRSSLRLEAADLGWLGLLALYAVLLSALCFVLSSLALRRRRLT